MRVAVALDDLRGDCGCLQAELGANAILGLGADVCQRADGARELAHPHLLPGRVETLDVAPDLAVPVGQLETERGRLGMHAVRAADHHRVFELERAGAQDSVQFAQLLGDRFRRLLEQQRLGGVHDIV